MTSYQLLTDTIEMFLEYRDKHGYDEATAKTKAVLEMLEGFNSGSVDALLERQESLRSQLTDIQTELERLAPRCEFGSSEYPSLKVQENRERYEKLAAKSAELETALGY